MATTYALVRNALASAIEALTPTKHASERFRLHRGEGEFADWCEANPASCFRRFEMLAGLDFEKQGIGSGDQWMLGQSINVAVAYPRRELGKYGIGNERALDDVITDHDFKLIDKAIGQDGSHQGNYVDGLHASVFEQSQANKTANVVFLILTYRLSYDRSY